MANASSEAQIIPFYSQPHVFGVIKDNTFYEETVRQTMETSDMPYSTFVLIGADKGIDNKFISFTNLELKQSIFGLSNIIKYGQSSLQAEALFNGNTKVWLMRVLPENAKYANIVWLAHYRKGKILDELGQETGKVRLEIKFTVVYASKPYLADGALSDADIIAFANSLATPTADPMTGYMTVPIAYARAIGHGKYGNGYSMSITRDKNAEKDFGVKMYDFNLIDNTASTAIAKQFAGSLHVSPNSNVSTKIDDVLDQYSTGSCPVHIHSFESSFDTIFDFYKNVIVAENRKYVQGSGANEDDVAELNIAQEITTDTFDPLFGLLFNTQTDELIPYYRNYTAPSGVKWSAPDMEIPNTAGATKPLNVSDWNTATVGATVLVAADPLNEGRRWSYTVINIDPESGNITYDEGIETAIDADQYDGSNIAQSVGYSFDGGHDGDFEEITVGGETRKPTDAEFKLLLSREFVKALRGLKDKRILSPSRINLDLIFDANYNMTTEETLNITSEYANLYDTATVLTDADSAALSTVAEVSKVFEYTDLNVKRALYDLNEFRNRNGMTMNLDQGAGCSLYLDCGLVGLKNVGVNQELNTIIDSMAEFTGRQTSVDLGYYEIYDPVSKRRVDVTVTYHLAKNLIPHLITYGMNKPFVNNYSAMVAMQTDDNSIVPGQMTKDSFRPELDLIDWDVKEKLYLARINYYEVVDEGKYVQRTCQNTRQLEASCLLEENNVRVLNKLYKGLEKACRGYLYEWNDPTVRKGYTEAQMDIYKPWIGTIVENLDISFSANEFEQERMMMHCYCEVQFRDIVKRIILEVNIKRPEGNAD